MTTSRHFPTQAKSQQALFFCYFEAVADITSRSPDILREERDRLNEMTKLFEPNGYPEIAYESWVEESMDLFDEIASSFTEGKSSQSPVTAAFTDAARGPALIQHFRVRPLFGPSLWQANLNVSRRWSVAG